MTAAEILAEVPPRYSEDGESASVAWISGTKGQHDLFPLMLCIIHNGTTLVVTNFRWEQLKPSWLHQYEVSFKVIRTEQDRTIYLGDVKRND